MTKKTTRKQLLSIMKNITKPQLQRKSQAACDKLRQTPEFENASVVMMFLSLSNEVDTSGAVMAAFQMEKTVLVPCIDQDKSHLIPIVLHTFDCEMTHDHYGLPYPAQGIPLPASEIDLVVVPGLGFDNQGNRLGRGGGHYDRLLSQNGFAGMTCGLALEEQVLQKIPIAEHDVPLKMLVTDSLIMRFK